MVPDLNLARSGCTIPISWLWGNCNHALDNSPVPPGGPRSGTRIIREFSSATIAVPQQTTNLVPALAAGPGRGKGKEKVVETRCSCGRSLINNQKRKHDEDDPEEPADPLDLTLRL
ncbi:hypothetical protein SAY86_026316 [Trapa natans]|uniref:Uncharacterized protein n=1 Tax=Trapa natans TaxID=22666 RepID=A0AAN7QEE6_TRANT|nr:hypothetical protein SAY86_026316 [Trapa natans]